MSFGAFAAGLGGGIENAIQTKRENKRDDAEDAEKKREFDEDYALRQKQIDAETAKEAKADAAAGAESAQAAANRKFESGLQLPKNWSKLNDQQKTDYLQQRQNAAARAGDDTVFKQTQDMINGIALNSSREATAAHTRAMTPAQVNELNARAAEEAGRNATARAIAAGRNATELQATAQRIASSAALAQYNGSIRMGIAQMAAANVNARTNADMAVRMAIDEYNRESAAQLDRYNQQSEDYRAGLRNPDLTTPPAEPTIVMPPAAMPSITVNVPGYGQQQPAMIPNSGAPRSPLDQARDLARSLRKGATTAVDPKLASIVKELRSYNVDEKQIRDNAIASGYPAAMVDAALRSGASLPPLPIPKATSNPRRILPPPPVPKAALTPGRVLPPLPVPKQTPGIALPGVSPQLQPVQ